MTPRWLISLIVTCLLLSGVTGIVYEVVWSRYVSLLIGASTYAHTLVLATFMGGLALGNYALGRRADESPRLLRFYALLELGIGAYCALFPTLFPLLSELYIALGRGLGSESAAIAPLKLALGVIAILPATVMMGGALPILGKYLVKHRRDIGSQIGLLYVIKSAGAAVGCLIVGFFLIEAFGLELSMILAALVNILIGLAFLWLDRAVEGRAAPEAPREATEDPLPPLRWSGQAVHASLIAIGIGGALSMLYGLVWVRLVDIVFGSSSQSFSLMLATFIAGIALGGLIVTRRLKRHPETDALCWFAWCELGVGLSVLALVPLYARLPSLFVSIKGLLSTSEGAFALLQLGQSGLLLALMILPTTLIGMTLPLATCVAVKRLNTLGKDVGALFAINTLGTLIGASLTGLVLIPLLGLQTSLYLGILASVALGLSLFHAQGVTPKVLGQKAIASLALFALIASWTGPWNYALLTLGVSQAERQGFGERGFEAVEAAMDAGEVLYQADGRDASVVVAQGADGHLDMKVKGNTDASEGSADMSTQLIGGHLPMLLSPQAPKRVGIVGLGSGVTAGAVLNYPEVQAEVFELSGAVIEAAAFFEDVNGAVLNNPRMRLHLGDARDRLLLDDTIYDLIISGPSTPWNAGTAQRLTLAWFESVHSRLSDSGVLLQSLQLYSLDDASLARTLRTLKAAFPYVSVWRFNAFDTMLLASKAPIPLDLEALSQRMAIPAVSAQLAPLHLRRPQDLLVHQVLSEERVARQFVPMPPLHSDTYPWLEYQAPRSRFRQEAPKLLDTLDERKLAPTRSNLLLAQLIRGTPMLAPELDMLRPAIANAAAPELLKALDKARALSRGKAKALSMGEVGALVLAEAKALEAGPLQEVCRALLPQLASALREAVSVVHAPSARPLRKLVNQCTEAHPKDALQMRALEAEALLELGRLKEASQVAQAVMASTREERLHRRMARILLALTKRVSAP